MKAFMEKMMGFMMDRTSKAEKEEMMAQMMDRFFGEMTPEDKQNMMVAMMPRMMEGVNMMEMMPKMMMGMMGGKEGVCCSDTMSDMTGGGQGMEMSGMPQMMMEMMPHCLAMLLPRMPKETRQNFTLKLIDTLIDHSCADMSQEEKEAFVKKAVAQLHAAAS